jgi:putative addiction module killer protein
LVSSTSFDIPVTIKSSAYRTTLSWLLLRAKALGPTLAYTADSRQEQFKSTVLDQAATFEAWFSGLRDHQAQARINARIRRLSLGNPGDVKPVGSGVSELRIDYGPGYRVYFMQRGDILALLLCGGGKRTQMRTSSARSRKTGRGDVWPLSDGRKNPLPGGMPPII